MKDFFNIIKNKLNKQLDELYEELCFYEVHNETEELSNVEKYIERTDVEIKALLQFENEKEVNLIKFNDDKSFHLWVICQPEGGNLIIEEYESDLTFEEYEYMLECSKCFDVTSSFTIEEIAWNTQIIIDNDMLLNNVCDKELYYLISDDILNDIVLKKRETSYERIRK